MNPRGIHFFLFIVGLRRSTSFNTTAVLCFERKECRIMALRVRICNISTLKCLKNDQTFVVYSVGVARSYCSESSQQRFEPAEIHNFARGYHIIIPSPVAGTFRKPTRRHVGEGER